MYREIREVGANDSWNSQVKSHIKPSESVLAEADRRESDSWQQCANIFRMYPRRTDDKLLNSLLSMVEPGSSVLDVGGWTGRFALPLALKGSHVTLTLLPYAGIDRTSQRDFSPAPAQSGQAPSQL